MFVWANNLSFLQSLACICGSIIHECPIANFDSKKETHRFSDKSAGFTCLCWAYYVCILSSQLDRVWYTCHPVHSKYFSMTCKSWHLNWNWRNLSWLEVLLFDTQYPALNARHLCILAVWSILFSNMSYCWREDWEARRVLKPKRMRIIEAINSELLSLK